MGLLIGYNGNLKIETNYTFEIDGINHKSEITSFDSNNKYVWVKISSNPQDVRLDMGKIIEIDVDGDGINDISLELVLIDSNGHIGIEYYYISEGKECFKLKEVFLPELSEFQ